KVLPFASTLDSKQLQRFKNEAQAAAHLHHTNIVPVHATGVERGVHYYSMQFIEGQTLAALIRELRQMEGLEAKEPKVRHQEAEGRGKKSQAEDQRSLEFEATGPYRPSPAEHSVLGAPYSVPSTASTRPVAALSTERSNKTPAYLHTVARLGIQAAEALE